MHIKVFLTEVTRVNSIKNIHQMKSKIPKEILRLRQITLAQGNKLKKAILSMSQFKQKELSKDA